MNNIFDDGVLTEKVHRGWGMLDERNIDIENLRTIYIDIKLGSTCHTMVPYQYQKV